jgi:hypothetical protein
MRLEEIVDPVALLYSISPTLNKQLLRKYSFVKKLQSQTVIREKLHKALSYKKAAREMLVKLTPCY